MCGHPYSVSHQYKSEVIPAFIGSGCGGALVFGHPCKCSGLPSTSVRLSLLIGFALVAQVPGHPCLRWHWKLVCDHPCLRWRWYCTCWVAQVNSHLCLRNVKYLYRYRNGDWSLQLYILAAIRAILLYLGRAQAMTTLHVTEVFIKVNACPLY